MPNTFKPNPSQLKFLQSKARFLLFSGGIGSGKTAVGTVKAVTKLNQGLDGIVVAPDFPHFAKSTWPQMERWFPWSRCVNRHLDHPYTQKKVLEFDVRGTVARVYYGGIEDEDAWTGPSINWFFFDEGGRKRTRAAFDVLAGRIRVGDRPQGWVTSTPNGKNHWMYEVFVKGVFPAEVLQAMHELGYDGPIVEYVSASTIENRENLDPMYYHSLLGLYSGTLARQELNGEFVSTAGKVWEDFGQENVTEQADFIPGVPVEWWVDDGFTKGHPRVILFVQVVPPDIHVFDEYVAYYEHGEDSVAAALAKGWPAPAVAYIDSSAAELRSRIAAKDIDVVKATHDVMEGIKHVAPFIKNGRGERHLLFHPRCTFAISEIPQYEYDETGTRPNKTDDHVADCLRYGLWTKDLDELHADYAQTVRAPHPQKAEELTKSAVPGAGNLTWYLQRLQLMNSLYDQEFSRMRALKEHVYG